MLKIEKYLQSIYTTIFSQKFSPDGNELAVCDNFGNISVFKLSTLLSSDFIDKPKTPHLRCKAVNNTLYSLECTHDHLICAPLNEIVGYKWKELAHNKGSIKSSFRLRIPNSENAFASNVETNYLVCDNQKNNSANLYAGCGNGEIYGFDLETSQFTHKYSAHTDGIYQIILKNNNQELVSASEDGQVKIWDLRANNCVATIKPFENSLCARPNLGRHINCVAVDDDNWLICGGGPKLSMWHLRSLKPMSTFASENDHTDLFMPNVLRIYDNQIVTGGNSNRLLFYTFESKLANEITTSSDIIYDVNMNRHSKANRILCVSGTSVNVDVCSNLSYKAMSFQLY